MSGHGKRTLKSISMRELPGATCTEMTLEYSDGFNESIQRTHPMEPGGINEELTAMTLHGVARAIERRLQRGRDEL